VTAKDMQQDLVATGTEVLACVAPKEWVSLLWTQL